MVQSNTCIGSCHFAVALPLGSSSRRTTPTLAPGGGRFYSTGIAGERQVQGRPTSHQLPAYIPKRAPVWTPYKVLEAKPGFEPGVKALQASALPLGHFADMQRAEKKESALKQAMERTTGLEPATPTLARLCSTN